MDRTGLHGGTDLEWDRGNGRGQEHHSSLSGTAAASSSSSSGLLDSPPSKRGPMMDITCIESSSKRSKLMAEVRTFGGKA